MYIINLTLTSETGVSVVGTVMVANSTVGTVYESCLPAVAKQVIQKNGTSALAKSGIVKHTNTCKTIRHNFVSTAQYKCS